MRSYDTLRKLCRQQHRPGFGGQAICVCGQASGGTRACSELRELVCAAEMFDQLRAENAELRAEVEQARSDAREASDDAADCAAELAAEREAHEATRQKLATYSNALADAMDRGIGFQDQAEQLARERERLEKIVKRAVDGLSQGACLTCGAEPGCNIDCPGCLWIADAAAALAEPEPTKESEFCGHDDSSWCDEGCRKRGER